MPPATAKDARGTAQGPGLAMNPRVAEQSAEQLRAYLEHGNPGAGMPSFADLPADDLVTLAKYLRRINADTIVGPVTATEPTRKITWGAPQPGDWLTYNGNDSANRYSPLKQITTANVSSLKLKWVFPIPYFGLETTPLAADGVLYVTGPNQVFALDALTGDAALALLASRQPRPGWRCQTGHQPRSRHSARQGLLRHRQRPPAGARSRHRQAALGDSHGAPTSISPTAAPWRRSSSTIPSSPASPAPITAFAVSSPPSSPIPALWSGGAGPCPAAASPASKPGKARNPSPAAVPPGSPAPTTRHPTPSTGPPAIRGPTATIATVPATTSTPTAFSRSTPRPAISSGTINSRRTI